MKANKANKLVVVKELGKCQIISGFEGVGERNAIGQIPKVHYFVAQQPLKYWGQGVEGGGTGLRE